MNHLEFFAICWFAIVLLAVDVYSTQAAPQPPLCQPGIIEEIPQHTKKECLALENSNQMSSSHNAYINRKASALVASSADLMKKINPRSEVDHVFLRFGKRR